MVFFPRQALYGGRYVIKKELGKGGFGITYLAQETQGNHVVIKTVNEDVQRSPDVNKLIEDFHKEALRLAACQHPHIVKYENFFKEENLPCLVMEYIPSGNLWEKITKKRQALEETEALLYIWQIGKALSEVHRKGFLHRDVRPKNILIRANKYEAVLSDFGLARDFIPDVTQNHTQAFAHGFSPIEQYVAEARRGEYTDVYALAATLYYLLTAKVPIPAFARATGTPLIASKEINPRISTSVNQAILNGMALAPEHRPQSVQEWLESLELVPSAYVDSQAPTRRIPGIKKLSEMAELDAVPPVSLPLQIPGIKQLQNFVKSVFVIPSTVSSALPPLQSTKASAENSPESTQTTNSATANSEVASTPEQSPTVAPTAITKKWECLHTLTGHSEVVFAIAFSPDGHCLASGSRDHTIKLWQVGWGSEIHTLSSHAKAVTSVAFSPNGELLASGSWDKTIKIWQVDSGKEIRTLSGHSDWVGSVAFSPNGDLLASSCGDSTIKIWQVDSGKEIRTLSGHSDWVGSVAFSPNGDLLASSSADKAIKFWDINSGKEILTLTGHSDVVFCIAFSPDGKLLASSSADKAIKFWDINSGREISSLNSHTDSVFCVAFSPNGDLLASSSVDKTIKVWQVNTGREIQTFSSNSDSVFCVAFSPNGELLARDSKDNTVEIWRLE